MNKETIKVLVADAYPVVREGLRAMLESKEETGVVREGVRKGEMRVVAEASNGLEAVAKASECQPDVVLLDIMMPDGLEAIRGIKKQYPDINVIILTASVDTAYVREAIRAGASGYLLKDASHELLCYAIRAVIGGCMLIKSSLLRETIAAVSEPMEYERGPVRIPSGVEEFTNREKEVLQLLANGRTNREIGKELNISEETAKKHVQNIIAKLGASDRTQAAVRAVRIGLISELSAQYVKQELNENSGSPK